MSIDLSQFKPYKIETLFLIYTGADSVQGLLKEGPYPMTGHGKKNNSVVKFIQNMEETEFYDSENPDKHKLYNCNNTISLANYGNFYATIQTKDFYLGKRVKALEASFSNFNSDFNKYENKEVLTFIATVINLESFRFNYGRKGAHRINDLEIMLPSKKDSKGNFLRKNIVYEVIDKKKKQKTYKEDIVFIPDFEFMENYIKELKSNTKADVKSIPNYFLDEGYDKACWYMDNIKINKFEEKYMGRIDNSKKINIMPVEFKEFILSNIFSFKKGKRITKEFAKKNMGHIPVIAGGETKQGILTYLDENLKDEYVFQADGCFTVAAYGTAGVVFYHNEACFIDDKALSFTFKQSINTKSNDNIFVTMFFVTILNKLRYKYNYGRGATEPRYSKEVIKLPICYEVISLDEENKPIYKLDDKGNKIPKINMSLGYHKDGYIPDFQLMEDYIKSLPFSKGLITT